MFWKSIGGSQEEDRMSAENIGGDSVVEKAWKGIGGNQKYVMPPEKFGRSTI